MKTGMTNRQKEVLKFLRQFHEREDRLPSTYEISREFAFSGNTAAVGHLKTLERKGYLQKRGGSGGWYRFTREEAAV